MRLHSYSRRYGRWSVGILTQMALLLCFAIPVFASQTPKATPPPTPKNTPAKPTPPAAPQLDRGTKDLADEYVDVLRQLNDVLNDYKEPLTDAKYDVIKRYLPDFKELQRKVQDSTFARSAQLLSEQLARHAQELQKIEKHIAESEEVYPMRLYRQVQSLRRDLANIGDLVDEDLAPRLSRRLNLQKGIDAYVAAALARHNSGDSSGPDSLVIVTVTEDTTNDGEQKTKVSARAPIVVARTVRLKDKSYKTSMKTYKVSTLPDVGTSRELADSVIVRSGSAPITITNRYGQVTVTGSETGKLIARWSIEAQANSHSAETEFIKSADLRVEADGDGYTVSATFAKPDERTARVVHSDLEVSVPRRNSVRIDNAFGAVHAEHLGNGLQASSQYSSVDVSDIHGPVSVECSMGNLTVAEVIGELILKNAYASIEVTDCEGPMQIRNEYASVSLSGSRGSVTIRNTGSIEVSDHKGDVSIDNSLGTVQVSSIKGNLTVSNQYQQISVDDVRGTVNVRGANAAIQLSNIIGGLTAVNKFGSISANSVSGPLDLDNQYASTSASLSDDFHGTSKIRNNYGSISLSVPESLDLFVKARAKMGSISSNLPMTTSGDNILRSCSIKMGKAKDSLVLETNNSSISVSSE
jgi:hypothetical protein